LDNSHRWLCQFDHLLLLFTPLDRIAPAEGIGMKRLYHISFDVAEQSKAHQSPEHHVKSYVSAECPYQARFMVKSRLQDTPWVSVGKSECWEIVDTQTFDPKAHKPEDVQDAMELGLVVVNIESNDFSDSPLALTA
jgi:hypothetical protein